MPTFEFIAAVRVMKQAEDAEEAREQVIMDLSEAVFQIENIQEVS